MKYVGIAVLLLLLAGCGGDPQPRFSPSPTISSPTTTAPAVETPQEFLRRWVRAMAEMERSGVTRQWRALNSPACRDCKVVADNVEAVYSAGRKVVGTHVRVLSVDREPDGRWRVRTRSAPTRIVARDGSRVGSFPGGPTVFEVALIKAGASYRVGAAGRVGE